MRYRTQFNQDVKGLFPSPLKFKTSQQKSEAVYMVDGRGRSLSSGPHFCEVHLMKLYYIIPWFTIGKGVSGHIRTT